MADPSYIVDGVLTDSEAWVGIAHDSLSLPAATVTWTSTADGQTGDFCQYMDLMLVVYARSDRSGTWTDAFVRCNNTSTGFYSGQELMGDGSNDTASVPSANQAGLWYLPNAGATANVFGCATHHFFDINSAKNTPIRTDYASTGGTESLSTMVTSFWNFYAPITRLDVITTGGNFIAGSTFSLFGLLPRMVA